MRNSFWQKKFSTIIALLVLVMGVGITSILTTQNTNFFIKATPTNNPQNIKITNITDTSFSISYTTEEKISGAISFWKDQNEKNLAKDDRDKEANSINTYNTHHFTVKDIKPQTTYFFNIISGSDTFLNNDSPFEAKTGSSIDVISDIDSISGSVLSSDGNKLQDGIVYLNTKDSNILSTIVKADGTYSFNLSTLRSYDLQSYIAISSDLLLSLQVVGLGQQSKINVIAGSANPIPLITLSQNYDFRINDLPLVETIASGSSENIGFPPSKVKTSTNNPQILTPRKNEEFIDQQPLFRGIASPGANIEIVIHSDSTQETKVTVDKNGVWTYRPEKPLEPGEHTITVTAPNRYGIFQRFTQSFTVHASGEQVNESATPSATPKITIIPSSTPTPTPTPTPTLTPTATPTPTILVPTFTPSPTLIPTFSFTPTPTTVNIPTSIPKPTDISPGNSSVISLGAIGIVTIIGSVLLFVLTKFIL